jgi:hypothetical protein
MIAEKGIGQTEGALAVGLTGYSLLDNPTLNKGSAFPEDERRDFGLLGLLPPHPSTIIEQLARVYENYSRKETDLERYIFLVSLQDRNETLFYRLLQEHITEMMPIIYTPTVGAGCQSYSHLFRRPRGLYISYPQRDEIDAMLDIAYVNDTAVIRRNPRVTAINSAIEVDVIGQVCADSIGTRLYSGVGGQMDFIRGASLSEEGRPVIALPSTTSRGESRIVSFLKPGAGVVTTRAHVHFVVTEYGTANLYGRNLRQRARALIEIAHPDHRAALEREAHERFKRLR